MTQTSYIFGFHALRIAIQNHPNTIMQLYLQTGRGDDRMQALLSLAESHGIPVSQTDSVTLDQLSQGQVHQGMLAQVKQPLRYSEQDLSALLELESTPLLLLLDCVQDPHNLGACLRSANAFNACAVIVPKDRAVGMTPVVEKVACGAAALTPLITVTNLVRTMKWLQQQGIWIVGTDDQCKHQLHEIDLAGPIAIVMGNEGTGMRRLVREQCDFLARIDLPGDVSSLNVSVAAGISLYEAQRQRIPG